ncbi:MAG: YdcF family protein [Armatimonadota bacterium]|nr:YdcF family protein [Armatimonadota bacterium]
MLSLLLPPIGPMLAALVLLVWRGRLTRALAGLLLLANLAFATPFAAGTLRLSLERMLPDTVADAAEAIVVLSGDIAHTRDAMDLGPLTLERMRVGATLHRATGLPILVTGGVVSRRSSVPIAELMRAAYTTDFGLAVRWVEPMARDTRENAERSAILLRAAGIERVFVVSHAWHLPRALAAFERAGLAPMPAPVRLSPAPDGSFADWVPNPRAALDSWYFLREWAGILVYRLRDG